jgi:hypothetical protein
MPNTRKPRRQTGPGTPAIDDFVNKMVSFGGGSVTRQAEGLRISFPKEADRSIAYTPKDQAEWELRLKWVEKQAAVYLLGAPVLYGVEWKSKTAKKANVRALRLSIGLSLSLGPAHPRRYTCTVIQGEKKIFVGEGGHLPNLPGTRLELTSLPRWAEKELGRFPEAIETSCEMFEKRTEVQHATGELREKFNTEFSDLDRLYRRNQGTDDRLYGLSAAGTDGSIAIEAELRRLQSIVLDRYRVRIRLRVLSLGVFEGDVPESVLSV